MKQLTQEMALATQQLAVVTQNLQNKDQQNTELQEENRVFQEQELQMDATINVLQIQLQQAQAFNNEPDVFDTLRAQFQQSSIRISTLQADNRRMENEKKEREEAEGEDCHFQGKDK